MFQSLNAARCALLTKKEVDGETKKIYNAGNEKKQSYGDT